MSFLSASRLRGLFNDLDTRLAATGDAADLYVIGGAAIALTLDDDRLTYDVDAIIRGRQVDGSHTSAVAVRQTAQHMAIEYGLPPDWLNDMADFAGFVPSEADPDEQLILVTDHLRIRAAGPSHLLAMKVMAAREKDEEDLALLAGRLGLRTTDEVLALAQRILGPNAVIPDTSIAFVNGIITQPAGIDVETPAPPMPAPAQPAVQPPVQPSGPSSGGLSI